ncbi:NAD(P)/FAD-dependent oxidoreductase [Microbacterium fluvii]|uniref:NAD(P)/FAD-dependent oxidoreductase n=1 Tax=Microbacterium fluvii TaxID=415215 RepID=A0ABW2HE23_9MICO|nr:FAD-dependent oxidoreductase [Microbacterium fluvii]MCU4672727.1 FAD-dependent oxidoreductase [Microbacterium fluvii]
MSTPRDAGRVVIVGAGLAGFSAAEQLRALGHEGPITLIDSEPAAYDRPPLSKRLFDDDFTVDSLAFATAEKLQAKRIDAIFGRTVASIDPSGEYVSLDDGSVVEADTVLLTVGGRARTLQIPGNDLPGVHVLRSFADAVAIRDRVAPGTRGVVIGAGLIGAELASSLLHAGAGVTLVDPVAVPLLPAVGEVLATHLHDMHATHGVEVVVGVTAAIEQHGDRLVVAVDEGPRLEADLVVVGVGLVPNTELAADAGIETDNGILVDAAYRTSAPRVFAAGDVARRRDDDGSLHRREEHWEAAQLSGQHAAYGMLGLEVPARGATWFWSDRHGVHLEATGRLSGPGEIVVRDGGAHPAVFLVEDGVLVGAAAVDDNNTVRAARRLIDQRIPVSEAELADPGVALRSLLRAAR